MELFHAAWRRLEQTRVGRFPPYRGAREAVETLRGRGLATALHTNRGRAERLDDRLREAELPRELFDVVHTPEDGGSRKPNVRSLQAVLTRLAEKADIRDPACSCVVSDQTQDADMALACGCRFIGVLTGAATHEDFEPFRKRGVIVVPSIADVPDIIRSF